MIDPPVALALAPARDVIVLDLWEGAPPAVPGVRLLPVEPHRWWLIDGAASVDTLAVQIGDRGALTPIGGGLTRATLTGPGWRELLTISGFFDVENPDFGPGMIAATTIHHVPVWIAPFAEDACEVFLPNSYAPTLADLWSRYAAEKGGSS
ncbi:sarcosine oxidase subunit gamma [Sphingomonas sp. MMS24-J45]|uniref:sarcosine oxidase subunit gamma n=1 Tax=Sphingomonas sp. MMS24-J45 TaxID=3238806 RepID=UPI00384C5B69